MRHFSKLIYILARLVLYRRVDGRRRKGGLREKKKVVSWVIIRFDQYTLTGLGAEAAWPVISRIFWAARRKPSLV